MKNPPTLADAGIATALDKRFGGSPLYQAIPPSLRASITVTLCAIWRCDATVHFASDSRLSFGATAADIAIKVVRAPYCIRGPRDEGSVSELLAQGDLGICFAGSASGSMFMKEAIMEVLPHMQAVPGYTDVSMANMAAFVFRAYRVVSRSLTQQIDEKGLSTAVIAGYCPVQKTLRAFKFSTTPQNEALSSEVLLADGDYDFIGSGSNDARKLVAALGHVPTTSDFIKVLQAVIEDPAVNGVGGKIQYAKFAGERFQTYGVWEQDDDGGVHYWRGPLDLHSPDFNNDDTFLLGYPLIDLSPDAKPVGAAGHDQRPAD